MKSFNNHIKNMFCLLILFSINFKLVKLNECKFSEYNITKPEPSRETCRSFSYIFDNKKCYYNGTKCINEIENSKTLENDTFYKLAEVHNNCGNASFFEPQGVEDCNVTSLVEGQCCFTNYSSKDDSSIHYSCIRTSKDKQKDIINDINIFFTKYYNSNYIVNSVICSGGIVEFYYNFIFILIIFLI